MTRLPRYELLDHTARQMSDHDPAYGGTRYALGYWQKADPDLPELTVARASLKRLGGAVPPLPPRAAAE